MKFTKLFITYGIPRSGKSTWAKEMKNKNGWIRVNKDDLREMLFKSEYDPGNEKLVVSVRDKIVETALRRGRTVVVDDTNFPFGGKHYKSLCEIAQRVGNVEVIEKYFEVSLKEALRRNKVSEDGKPVPPEVIENMYNKHVNGKPYDFKSVYFESIKPVERNKDLPECVIFDVDGTLAITGDRSPYDMTKVGIDNCNENIAYLNNIIYRYTTETRWMDVDIIIFSGREDCSYEDTKRWFKENNIYFDKMYMRKTGDSRKDSIIKKELYEEHIKDKYNVICIFDDRDQVVNMWRSLGLTCAQVNYGDF